MVDIWEGDKGRKFRGGSRAGLGGPNYLFHVKSLLTLLFTKGNIAVLGGGGVNALQASESTPAENSD